MIFKCLYCARKAEAVYSRSFKCTYCPSSTRFVLLSGGELEVIVMDSESKRYTIMLDFYDDETRIYDNWVNFFNPVIVLDYTANITPDNLEKKLRSILTFM